jgi:hypothetical protein
MATVLVVATSIAQLPGYWQILFSTIALLFIINGWKFWRRQKILRQLYRERDALRQLLAVSKIESRQFLDERSDRLLFLEASYPFLLLELMHRSTQEALTPTERSEITQAISEQAAKLLLLERQVRQWRNRRQHRRLVILAACQRIISTLLKGLQHSGSSIIETATWIGQFRK